MTSTSGDCLSSEYLHYRRETYFKSNSSESGASRVTLGSQEAIFEGSCMSTDQSACVSGSSSLKSCPSTEPDSDLSEIEVSTLAYSVVGLTVY